MEKALFRGILFEEVRRRAGTAAAHFTSSVLLAVLHGVEPGVFLYYFVVALALAYAYHKHGLVASVLVHSTHGFIFFFFIIFIFIYYALAYSGA